MDKKLPANKFTENIDAIIRHVSEMQEAYQQLEKRCERCERCEGALKDIAKQATCVEQENDPERVPDDAGSKLGDIEWGYDCIIRVAREALSGEGEKEESNK